MNRRQRVEHSLYVRKINSRLYTLHAYTRVSLRLSRDEVDTIFRNKILDAITQTKQLLQNVETESAKNICNRLNNLIMEVSTTNDLFYCYGEFIKIRRQWRKVKAELV